MRHLKRTAKLGRTGTHRNRMLASMVCSLIKHRRITTTLAKAKAARSVADKMITLGKGGTLHDRRLASSRLHQDEEAVKILFTVIAPTQKERRGGYTRIVRLGSPSGKHRAFRQGDAAEMVLLEFVDVPVPEETAPEAKTGADEKKSGEAAKPAEAKKEKEAKQEKEAAAAPA
jgi:large subunit ribosomal protein L17